MAGLLWGVERLLKKIGSWVLPATIALSCAAASSAASATLPPFPSCAGSGAAPVVLGEALSFCGFSGLSCCDAAADAALRDQFVAMNISDPVCAAAVKATTCAHKCSPWASSAEPSNNEPTTTTMAGSPLHCGSSSSTPSSKSPQQQPHQETMCLEMLAAGSFQTMVAHPDGSSRVFLATQDGRILLASAQRSPGAALRLYDDGARPFLDLAGRVHHDADLGLGLKGVAFHREFASSGRFFVSYTCKSASPTCGSAGSCSAGAAHAPCLYQLVVAEFCAEGEPGDYSMATHAYPSEVRRVFTMGLPSSSYRQNGGGQILFPPMDADSYYLHLIVGHGGGVRDLSKGPYYGKILSFDVDGSSTPNAEQLVIVAMGLALSSPRGCSFDSQRPWHLYCANVDEYEQVYLISSKAGKHDSSSADEAATGSIIISHGRRPAPSMVGGLVYRGSADPSLLGRYLYMYGSSAWAAMETPGSGGGLYSSSTITNMRCSRRTPLPCSGGGVGGRVLSWGEDNGKDAFVLATDGVYRVVAPGLCSGGGSKAAAEPQPWTSALAWMLFLGGFGLVLAIYQIYTTMFGQAQPCFGGTISCHCLNVTTSSNSSGGPATPETTTTTPSNSSA